MSISDRWSIVFIIIALIAIFVPIFFAPNKLHEVRINFSKWIPTTPLLSINPPAMFAADRMITEVEGDIQNYNNINMPIRFKNVIQPLTHRHHRYVAQPSAWVVQLVGLKDYAQTQLLIARLQKQGFSAYAQPVNIGKKTLYRVRVGPVLTREEAQTSLKALAMIVKQKAVILLYDPLT